MKESNVYNIGSGYVDRGGAELLWVNENPYARFPEQTIPIDNMAKYSLFLVYHAKVYDRSDRPLECSILIQDTKTQQLEFLEAYTYRNAIVRDDGIHFSLSEMINWYSSADSVHDSQNYNVPHRIYGLR
jgi:hypothetical protein